MKPNPINKNTLICWLILWLIAIFSYLPFITNFTFGNHDWQWIKQETPLTLSFFEGRFSGFIFPYIFFEGKILPVLNTLISLIFFSLSSVLLLNLWQIPIKKIYYTLLGSTIILAPYTLSWFYFAINILSSFIWLFLIIISYTLLTTYTFPRLICSIILLTLSIGGYAPSINFIFTIFFSLILNDLCFNKYQIRQIIQKYTPHFFAIISTLLCYLIIEHYLKKMGYINGAYNTQIVSLNDIPQKLLFTINSAIKQFFIKKSFFSTAYKYINLLILIISITLLIKKTKKNLSYLFFFFINYTGFILSSVLTLFISLNTEYVLFEPRIEFFGLIYIYAFSFAVLLKSTKTYQNIAYIFLIFLTLLNLRTNFYATKIWNLGYKSEQKLIDRTQNSIKSHPNFNIKQNYTFLIGGTLDFRSRFYLKDNTIPDGYTLTAPYISWHLPHNTFNFYAEHNLSYQSFDTFWRFIPTNAIVHTTEINTYIKNKITSWPQDNALFIDNNTIILTLTPSAITSAKNWFEYNI